MGTTKESPELGFGDRLRQLRREAGLTQEELAERAGVAPEMIGALERGVNRAPHRDTVLVLANALGLSQEERAALLAAARRRPPGLLAATAAAVPATRESPTATSVPSAAPSALNMPATAPTTATPIQTFLIADVRGHTRFTLEHGDEAAVRLTARFAAVAQAAIGGAGRAGVRLGRRSGTGRLRLGPAGSACRGRAP